MTNQKRSSIYMLILAAVLTMFYGGMAILWELHPSRFTTIDSIIMGDPVDGHVALHNPYSHLPLPFFDLYAVLASRKCLLIGYDVIARNPCDPMDRPTIYSPLLQNLPLELIGEENILIAGTALGFTFLLTVLFVLRPQSKWELAFAALAVVSPATFFAVERSNLDLLIFILVIGTALLPQQYLWARLLLYIASFGGFLIKFYPLTILIAAIREKLCISLSIAAATAGGFSIFTAIYWSEIQRLSTFLPVTRVFRAMFGGQILPRAIQRALNLPELTQYLIYSIFLAGSLGAGFLIARKLSPIVARLGTQHPKLTLLLSSALLIVGCFFAGFNIYYRAIFLLPVFPGLFALRLSTQDPVLRKLLTFSIPATLFCLYADIVRLQGVTPLGRLLGRGGAEIIVLIARESIWWLVITLLVGCIIACLRLDYLLDNSLDFFRLKKLRQRRTN